MEEMKASFRYATRINSFKSRPDLNFQKYDLAITKNLIKRLNNLRGLTGFFMNFPEHFVGNEAFLKSFFRDSGIQFDGFNIRFPEELYFNGGFTNPSSSIRSSALDLCKKAIDACRDMGGKEIVIWPAFDGIDYSLQADFETLWHFELENIAKVAEYGNDLKISIEFKPADPRRRSIIDSTATTLLAIEEIGAHNLGITLDYCHSLMAKENPALSAVHCLRKNKLFGMHLNDGYGHLDDGMIVGSVTPSIMLELIYYLIKYDFKGVIYFDTFPVREDPLKEFEMNIAQIEKFISLIEQIDTDKLSLYMANQDALGVMNIIFGSRI
jgi:xylose isomerase